MPGEFLSPNSWASTAPSNAFSNAFWFGANQIAPNLASLLRQQPAPYFADPNTPNAQGKLPDSASWDRIDPRLLSGFGEAAQQGVNMVGPPMKAVATAAVPLVAGIARRLAMPAAEEAANVAKGIRAYHGSPHDFEKFDLSKIGTGEGAQAYGHGLYFAEKEGTAQTYRDALSPSLSWLEQDNIDRAWNRVAGQLKKDGIEPHQIRSILNDFKGHFQLGGKSASLDANMWPEAYQPVAAQAIKRIGDRFDTMYRKEGGRMYEVNINAKPEQFLDWDKPLAQQPDIFGRLKESGIIGEKSPPYQITGQATPQAIVQMPVGRGTMESRLRDEAGIPGIKYLDQGSRTAGEGSSNYVVFNDKLIDILRKYGLAGLIAGGAAADSLPIPQQQPPVFSQ